MRRNISLCVFVFIAGCWGLAPGAKALPSYARQTGLPCSGCHTTPPELNASGRLFKLLAYSDRSENSITAPSDKRRSGLNMLEFLPLSAFLETSLTSTKVPQPGSQNWNFEFPQDISLYLAGAWATHLGSFLQITYDMQDDHFSIDNTDIRYADKTKLSGKELDYGLTLNNNPTVEDLWNSTPAWGFPFIAPDDSVPTPTAAPVINGLLGVDVAGLGAFAMWDQHLYFAGTLYRSDHVGDTQPTTGQCCSYNIRGVAPYWRLAWQQTGRTANLEVGAYGIHMKSTPGAVTGPEDSYTNFGPDIQYDRTFGKDVLSVRGSYVRENSALVASADNGNANPGPHHLNASNANVEYHVGNRYSGTFGWFLTNGTTDIYLYPQAAVTGSANGNPRSAGIMANVSYWPIQNLDLAVQYTDYTRFNGGTTNYDGAGRDASDNNTVYLLARFVF
jgi:hypothetical protein